MIHAASLMSMAAAIGATVTSAPALAWDRPACADHSVRQQLVCGSDACLRLETQHVCDAAPRPVAGPQARPHHISRQEWSDKRLERLIASID